MKSFLRRRMNQFSGSAKKNTKQISFNKKVSEIPIPILVESDIEQRWYTPQEFNMINDYNLGLLKKMGKSCIDGGLEEDDCERGLETQHPEFRRKSTTNRRLCISLVMQEQEMQHMQGIFNPQSVAEVYSRNSQAAKRFALIMGRQDENFVREDSRLM
jgi:hypothetical protein